MGFEIFIEEDRQKERELLTSYDLDVELFNRLGFKLKQIVPERNCFRIETDKGFFCLKKMNFSQDDMKLMQEMTEHLKNNGFANTFDIVKQENGEILMPYEGSQYYLTQWMDGRESDYMNMLDIKESVEALALFHRSSEGFVPSVGTEHRRLYGRWRQSFVQKLAEMQAARELIQIEPKQDNSLMMTAYLKACENKAKHAMELAEGTACHRVNARDESKMGFIHHDYGMHNILHTFENRTFIGGLEGCAFDIRMHDLGHLIFRMMRRSGWDMDRVINMIDTYDAVYKLEKDDYKALAAYFTFPHDFKQLYKQHYIEGKEVEDLEELDRINLESEYSNMRESFLEEFESYIEL